MEKVKMSDNILSAKDEALLVLEYLENEHMPKTFLNFLDENKHLRQLRSHLHTNYENCQNRNDIDETNNDEIKDFQAFFNLSKRIVSQINQQETEQLTYSIKRNSSEFYLNDDFLNDFISQTPSTDYQQDLPDTPVSLNLSQNNDDMKSIEQLFSIEHQTPSQTIVQNPADSTTRSVATVPYTKCIVVTQDFLQSIYNLQTTIMNSNTNIHFITKPKRRRRRTKLGKENRYYQQRKIMPKTADYCCTNK